MGKISSSIEKLQGEDKMLYEQIMELVDDLDPANVLWCGDVYDIESWDILQILKGGGGEKEIYDYLFTRYCHDTDKEIKRHFFALACAETSRRLAGLYCSDSGRKPFSIKKKRDMVQDAVKILLEHRSRKDFEQVKNFLAGYDLPFLVEMAGELLIGNYIFPQPVIERALHNVLFHRGQRIKESFKWTNEHRDRLVFISERLFNACVKGRKEGEETAAFLDNRLKQGSLKAYELHATIHAYPHIEGDRKAAEAVERYFAKQTLQNERIYMRNSTEFWQKREVNWLSQTYARYTDKNAVYGWGRPDINGHFPPDFNRDGLCHAIWSMLAYPNNWSVPDILSVWRVQAFVEVNQQYFEDVEGAGNAM